MLKQKNYFYLKIIIIKFVLEEMMTLKVLLFLKIIKTITIEFNK